MRNGPVKTLFPATIALTLSERHSAKLCLAGFADHSERCRAFRQNNLRADEIGRLSLSPSNRLVSTGATPQIR